MIIKSTHHIYITNTALVHGKWESPDK
jgi:hypothetical protein